MSSLFSYQRAGGKYPLRCDKNPTLLRLTSGDRKTSLVSFLSLPRLFSLFRPHYRAPPQPCTARPVSTMTPRYDVRKPSRIGELPHSPGLACSSLSGLT